MWFLTHWILGCVFVTASFVGVVSEYPPESVFCFGWCTSLCVYEGKVNCTNECLKYGEMDRLCRSNLACKTACFDLDYNGRTEGKVNPPTLLKVLDNNGTSTNLTWKGENFDNSSNYYVQWKYQNDADYVGSFSKNAFFEITRCKNLTVRVAMVTVNGWSHFSKALTVEGFIANQIKLPNDYRFNLKLSGVQSVERPNGKTIFRAVMTYNLPKMLQSSDVESVAVNQKQLKGNLPAPEYEVVAARNEIIAYLNYETIMDGSVLEYSFANIITKCGEMKISSKLHGQSHGLLNMSSCQFQQQLKQLPILLKPLPDSCNSETCTLTNRTVTDTDTQVTQPSPMECNDTAEAVVSWNYNWTQNCNASGFVICYGIARDNGLANPLISPIATPIGYNLTMENSINLAFPGGNKYVAVVVALYKEADPNFVTKVCFKNKLGHFQLIDLKKCESTVPWQHESTNGSTTTKIVVASVVIIFLALLIGCFLYFWCTKRRNVLKAASLVDMSGNQRRYSEFPRKPTVNKWELDTRKLVIFENEVLGKGAFGIVYKGRVMGRVITHIANQAKIVTEREEAENPIVAVKQCYDYADEQTKRDFLQEIALMQRLHYHPRLVNILHCITKTTPLSLITEFCSEGDLAKYLRSRRKYMLQLEKSGVNVMCSDSSQSFDTDMIISLKDVISMAFQISDGMEYISQKGFIHRDVAARNVLVCKSRNVKIGDFGLCRFVYSSTEYMSKGGKLPVKWMALEAVQEYVFSTKTDVWSFGVLLFELITLGGMPYPDVMPLDGDFRRAMIEYLVSGRRMEQPDNCPYELYDMMLDCWLPDPDSRSTFSQLKERLRKMLESIQKNSSVDYGLYLDPTRSYYNVLSDEKIAQQCSSEELINEPIVIDDCNGDVMDDVTSSLDDCTSNSALTKTSCIESTLKESFAQNKHSNDELHEMSDVSNLTKPMQEKFCECNKEQTQNSNWGFWV